MPSQGDFDYKRNDTGITITKYTGSASSVKIPAKIDNFPVTTIGRRAGASIFLDLEAFLGAFSGCSSLTSVIIPDSVTHIGNRTFSGCSSLTSVIIPDSVTYIGSEAFGGCSSLTSIVIPNSVTTIWDDLFENFSSLTTIYFPRSLMNVADNKDLHTLILPSLLPSLLTLNLFKGEVKDNLTRKSLIRRFLNEYRSKIHYYDLPTRFLNKISRLKNASNVSQDVLEWVKQIENLAESRNRTAEMINAADSILDDILAVHELLQEVKNSPAINLAALINSTSDRKVTNFWSNEIAELEERIKAGIKAIAV